ncbi:MAG: hypothetical protein ABWZ88_18505 [Variovorax sp.]
MHITRMAFALAALLPASLLAAPGARSPADSATSAASALGNHPAVIRYVSNDAPFVVFDVSPRSVTTLPADFADITLSFIATDALQQLNVFAWAAAAHDGSTRAANRVACGAREAGYGTCSVPARALLAGLERGEGQFGLRVEATGLEGDHSTVVITLPVKFAVSKRPLPAPASRPPAATPAPVLSPRTLTLLSAPQRLTSP